MRGCGVWCGGRGLWWEREAGERVGGEVEHSVRGIRVSIGEPREGDAIGDGDDKAGDVCEGQRPRDSVLLSLLEYGNDGSEVALVLLSREVFEAGSAQSKVHEFEHHLLASGLGDEVVEVALEARSQSLAQIGGELDFGKDRGNLVVHDNLDEVAHHRVSRLEGVVKARERHAGLSHDRARRSGGNAVCGDDAQCCRDELPATIGRRHASHAAPDPCGSVDPVTTQSGRAARRVSTVYPRTGAVYDRLMVTPLTVPSADGRSLVVFDTGQGPSRTLVWHNGSPHSGALLEPIVRLAASRDTRLISYARPSYGGSTPQPGRSVADAATDVERIADALALDAFVTMGASGGGPHALAVAAALGSRVSAVATFASPAPFDGSEEWFAGMAAPAALRAAVHSREARALFAETDEFDPNQFIPADLAALDGEWGAVGADAGPAGDRWPDGLVDDDVAFAKPWGFELDAVESPVFVVQGGLDRIVPVQHGRWLARDIRGAVLEEHPEDGHVSVMRHIGAAMDWANGVPPQGLEP